MSYWTSIASKDDTDVVIWFNPKNYKDTLRALRAAVDKVKDTPDFFSLDLYVRPDCVTPLDGLPGSDAEDFECACTWTKEEPAVFPLTDTLPIQGGILKADDKHFWFVVWDKADTEFQSDYFAWADLPEGVLEDK